MSYIQILDVLKAQIYELRTRKSATDPIITISYVGSMIFTTAPLELQLILNGSN
jgi:hypothetical protein